MTKRLPILIETAIGQTVVLRKALSDRFERQTRALVAESKQRITCSTGCSHCCYHPISISITEGITIYRWLVSHGKWTIALRDRLRVAADQQMGTPPEILLLAMVPCPLLEGNKCMSHSARPLICRTYFAVSDTHYCHPHRLGEHTKIVPRTAVVDEFHRSQGALLRKHRLQLLTIPIAVAVLLAERVCSGEVDFGAVDKVLIKEYGEKS